MLPDVVSTITLKPTLLRYGVNSVGDIMHVISVMMRYADTPLLPAHQRV